MDKGFGASMQAIAKLFQPNKEPAMKRLNSKSGCAVEVTLSVMGGTWKPIILFQLLQGKKRFGAEGLQAHRRGSRCP